MQIYENKVIHCKTEEEAKILFKYLMGLKMTWENGETLTSDTQFFVYDSKTCYIIEECTIALGSIEYFKKNGYKIIEFDKLDISREIEKTRISALEKEMKNLKTVAVVPCPNCKMAGTIRFSRGSIVCPRCKGYKLIEVVYQKGMLNREFWEENIEFGAEIRFD